MPIEKQVIVQITFPASQKLAALLGQEARKAKADSTEAFIMGLLEESMKSVTLEKRKRTRKRAAANGVSVRQNEVRPRKKPEQVAV